LLDSTGPSNTYGLVISRVNLEEDTEIVYSSRVPLRLPVAKLT
jgi:hypothetical protein